MPFQNICMMSPRVIRAFLLQSADDISHTDRRRILQQDMYMVPVCLHGVNIPMMPPGRFEYQLLCVLPDTSGQDRLPILCDKYQMYEETRLIMRSVMIAISIMQMYKISAHKPVFVLVQTTYLLYDFNMILPY